MNTIVLNSTNIVSGSNNSSLTYRFPNSVTFDDHQVAVQSVSMYYSWTNINATTLKIIPSAIHGWLLELRQPIM